MNKPFNLAVKDLRDGIARLIDESQLPISMVTSIVGETFNSLVGIERMTLEKEKADYEASLKTE